jgi:hypothetical protein
MTDQACADDAYDGLHAAYSSLASLIVSGVKIVVPREFSIMDVVTGDVVGVVAVSTPQIDIVGTNTGTSTARSLSVCARLLTGHWQNGRQLQGRTFIGPLGHTAVASDGTFNASTNTTVDVAFDGLISGIGARLAVYHRPSKVTPGSGYYADVVGITSNRIPSNVRSRLR